MYSETAEAKGEFSLKVFPKTVRLMVTIYFCHQATISRRVIRQAPTLADQHVAFSVAAAKDTFQKQLPPSCTHTVNPQDD